MWLIINHHYSRVELFRDVLHVTKPFQSLDVGVRRGFVHFDRYWPL